MEPIRHSDSTSNSSLAGLRCVLHFPHILHHPVLLIQHHSSSLVPPYHIPFSSSTETQSGSVWPSLNFSTSTLKSITASVVLYQPAAHWAQLSAQACPRRLFPLTSYITVYARATDIQYYIITQAHVMPKGYKIIDTHSICFIPGWQTENVLFLAHEIRFFCGSSCYSLLPMSGRSLKSSL